MSDTGPATPKPWDDAPLWDGSHPEPSTPAPAPSAAPSVRRHPVLMAIGGLLLGTGVGLLLVHAGRIALGTNALYLPMLLGLALGVFLAYALPARRT